MERAESTLLESIDAAARSYGPTKGVSVPMGENGTLEGRICGHFTLLHSKAAIDEKIVNQLSSIF